MSGFIPVIAFCAAFAAGDLAPIYPAGCVIVSDDVPHVEKASCAARAEQIAVDPSNQWRSYQELLPAYGSSVGKMRWFYWCPQEGNEVEELYDSLGMPVPEGLVREI